MNPVFQTLVVICCLGAGLASHSANRYVDNVIQTSWRDEARAMGVDPVLLPDFNIHFQNNGRITGDVSFTYGNITGLSWIRKESECVGPRFVGGELTIGCTLSLSSLNTKYRLVSKFGRSVSYGLATGYVSDTAIHVVIAGRPPNFVGFVKSFRITRMGSITPTLAGLPQGIQNQANSLQSTYRANVSNFLINVIQQRFMPALSRALSYKSMPRM